MRCLPGVGEEVQGDESPVCQSRLTSEICSPYACGNSPLLVLTEMSGLCDDLLVESATCLAAVLVGK
jgi:hypothetical protein